MRRCPQARKFLPAARDYLAASLWRRAGLRINETAMLDIRDWRPDLGEYGKLHVRFGKGSRGPRAEDPAGARRSTRSTSCWTGGWPTSGTSSATTGTTRTRRCCPASAATPTPAGACGSVPTRCAPGWPARSRGGCRRGTGRLTPHGLRHYCASSLYARGMDLKAIQELLGHSWLSTTTRYIHVHDEHIEQAWTHGEPAGRRPAGPTEGEPMRWNLRMNAAERGIWKSTEMRRLLAEAGLEISAGKMSALWTEHPDHDPAGRPGRDLRGARLHPGRPADLRAGAGRRPPAAAAAPPAATPAPGAAAPEVTPRLGRNRQQPPA